MIHRVAPKLAYGALFCVALPAALVVWAQRLDAVIDFSGVKIDRDHQMSVAWWGVAIAGVVLMAWAMFTLWRHAGGLPMNAFPPPRLTRRGPYWLLAHPIYVGAVMIVGGVSGACASAAGLLIVTPAVALGCAALVLGFENRDLHRRFGDRCSRAWLTLPDSEVGSATAADRARTVFVVFGWWILGYEVVGHLPVPDAIELMRPPESGWPVIMWWTGVYSLAYVLAPFAVMATRDRVVLSVWGKDAMFGMTVGFLIMLALPFVATLRGYDSTSAWGWLMELNRTDGVGGRAAFPSFHVYWSFMAAALLWHRNLGLGVAAGLLACLIAVSCITAGMHAIADVVAGAMLCALALHRRRLWHSACAAAQRIANGWCEWNIGPARLLIHGVYAGLAAAVGVLCLAAFAPLQKPLVFGVIAVVSLVGAGVWGQVLVGSKRLQRPFGYFGSVIAILCCGAGLAAAGFGMWPILAATAGAAPWIQGIGRLRCLVQGCCHGAPSNTMGIVHLLPQSRVAAISGLGGVPIHPTPLYSMLANVVIGLLLFRLFLLAAPASLVVGAYLFLQGAARFVEESYRGEAQTRQVAGLRIYQWFALAMALVGAGVMCMMSPAVHGPELPTADASVVALSIGLLYALAMGVEFPRCSWPMSRLTPQ